MRITKKKRIHIRAIAIHIYGRVNTDKQTKRPIVGIVPNIHSTSVPPLYTASLTYHLFISIVRVFGVFVFDLQFVIWHLKF